MRFSRLIEMAGISPVGAPDAGGPDPDIRSVHYRSQSVGPGGLFVAVPGQVADGHAFVDDAVARGAVALVTQRSVDTHVPCVVVADSRNALARISDAFYGHPSQGLKLIGITGTNGKTTITYLLESMLRAAGQSPGVVGTVNYRYAGQTFENPVTTPESLDLQHILSEMTRAGVTHAALEVSSHAIDLSRVDGCQFDVAAFTNLTQDHLDYHETMDAYWACKQRLFTDYLARGAKKDRAVAVLNTGNPYGRELVDTLRASVADRPVMTYGMHGADNHVRPGPVVRDADGIRGEIASPVGNMVFRSRLVGEHNLENILCAVAIGLALDLPREAIRDGLSALACVPGRLERVESKTGRHVFVDYAHTPDALDNVLRALAELTPGRLVCVFGCGGDRDREKRPLMGKIAADRADVVMVTSDNPRTENPQEIIDDILAGMSPRREGPEENRVPGVEVIVDRRQAIRRGLMAAGPGDVVLIAGKGHETYQILGTDKLPFDDRREAGAVLAELEGAAQ